MRRNILGYVVGSRSGVQLISYGLEVVKMRCVATSNSVGQLHIFQCNESTYLHNLFKKGSYRSFVLEDTEVYLRKFS